MQAAAAFILAGGMSSRMGTDKALLEYDGRSLLARAIALARSITTEMFIVGDAAKFGVHGNVVSDIYTERGPLGGIHSALTHTRQELNLVLGVDLPLLQPEFLHFLLSVAEASPAVVTVPRISGCYEPLCAVYRKTFAFHAEQALQNGRNKIDTLYQSVPTRIITQEEMSANGFRVSMFRNVNTPADWEKAKQELSGADTLYHGD